MGAAPSVTEGLPFRCWGPGCWEVTRIYVFTFAKLSRSVGKRSRFAKRSQVSRHVSQLDSRKKCALNGCKGAVFAAGAALRGCAPALPCPSDLHFRRGRFEVSCLECASKRLRVMFVGPVVQSARFG